MAKNFSNVPLNEKQIAAVTEAAAAAGGFHVTDVCDHCRESLLFALPAERAEKHAYGWKRRHPTYATVCVVCDDAYKMPKLLTDGV